MRNTPDLVSFARAGPVAVITADSPPVNALSTSVRAHLFAAIQRASEDPALSAIVLICAGRTFFAGADLREFGKPPEEPTLPELIELIESRRKPVVAAIHGTALGGGFELALSCHYRVASSSARVGLPEVTLGLMPGGGGTLRLPRLIGVPQALDIIVSGRHVDAQEALALGALDAVFAKSDLRTSAIAFAARIAAVRPLPRARERDEHLAAARAQPEIFVEFRRANARRLRGFVAPEHCIRAVEAAVRQPFEAASKFEHETFDAGRKALPCATVEKIILDFAAAKGIRRRPITDAEILERCLYPTINEGAKILEAGIAARASDIDVVWLHGYGWPAWRGGPMFYADSLGADTIVAALRGYAAKHGTDFTPAALLSSMADEKRRFFTS